MKRSHGTLASDRQFEPVRSHAGTDAMSGGKFLKLTEIRAVEGTSTPLARASVWVPMWLAMDAFRRMQGEALQACGLGPIECSYSIVASDARWRLRRYSGGDAHSSLLIVAAPIKQPYIWDLLPGVSVVRYCRSCGFRVYLLEWTPPSPANRNAGLAAYAGQSIGEAVAAITRASGVQPLIMGHSLGGTLAAIFAALAPDSIRGLVLLGAPLCFEKGSSPLRDGIVSIVPNSFPDMDVVPGSLLSQLCALACPETFVLARLTDAGISMSDPHAALTHARIERWALDEFPLQGKLVQEILEWLFREDRFCEAMLPISGKTLGPASLRGPTLMVVNPADEVAPPTSIAPFVDAMAGGNVRVVAHAGEVGVGLQHLAILAGRQAHAHVWPKIVSWMQARA
jgi:poly[(R)-3-hydroxyalkanoate] polymerase subunit PhaC